MKQAPAAFDFPNLPLQLLALREQLMQRFRPLLVAKGLTEQQWRILRALDAQGPMEPRELCKACVILSPSLVGILSRMESEGLIHRQRMDHDQRRVTVQLTARSRTLIETLNPAIQAVYAELQTLVGRDQLRAFQDSMDRLQVALA
jgi:homoprotocatechuate degradation regulator HpaR